MEEYDWEGHPPHTLVEKPVRGLWGMGIAHIVLPPPGGLPARLSCRLRGGHYDHGDGYVVACCSCGRRTRARRSA